MSTQSNRQGAVLNIPACIPKSEQATEVRPELDGKCIWTPDKLPKRSLDKYLKALNTLFESAFGTYCEEKALLFLHECDYDIEMAVAMLRPWHPEDDVDDEPAERYEGDDFCFLCRDGGDLLLCDFADCKKVYHPACLGLEQVPDGEWNCPYHKCVTCHIDTELNVNCCAHCATSYCPDCIPDELSVDVVFGFLCKQCIDRETHSNGGLSSWFLRRVVKLLQYLNTPLLQIPRINKKELDICSLYREVVSKGGIHKVVHKGGWADIRRKLKLPSTANATLLQKYYMDILYPYEKRFFSGSVPMADDEPEIRMPHGPNAMSIVRSNTSADSALRQARAKEREQRRAERETRDVSARQRAKEAREDARTRASAQRTLRHAQRTLPLQNDDWSGSGSDTQNGTRPTTPTSADSDEESGGHGGHGSRRGGHGRKRGPRKREPSKSPSRIGGHRGRKTRKRTTGKEEVFDVVITEELENGFRIECSLAGQTRHGIVFHAQTAV